MKNEIEILEKEIRETEELILNYQNKVEELQSIVETLELEKD